MFILLAIADVKISGAGILNTYAKLIPEHLRYELQLPKMFSKTDLPSVSHIYGFFGLDGESDEVRGSEPVLTP